MSLELPVAGDPILDTWGIDVAKAINRLIPIQTDADRSTNSTSLQDITGMTFPVVAGRIYTINGHAWSAVDHATSQCQWGFQHPGGTCQVTFRAATTGVNTEETQRIGAVATATTFGNAGATASPRHCYIIGRYVCTTSGTFALQFTRSGTSAGVTVGAGSGALVIESAV